ncbi:hypothetical protein C3V36_02820 [Lachnospiraceae bacterium oral taxon 500]|nr:hypothetical protein C3V36_02820 [Lachnospiraceae bacterium oral taxon 500]
MNATAKRAYSFCGASPADREHEVRQMRSIWSAGEKQPISQKLKRASINECDREAGIFILRRFTGRQGARSAANAEHLVCW